MYDPNDVYGSSDVQGSFMKGLAMGKAYKGAKKKKQKAEKKVVNEVSNDNVRAERAGLTSRGSREQVA